MLFREFADIIYKHCGRTKKTTDKFAAYIDSLSWDAQDSIETEFEKRILSFNQNGALGYACADLFLQIMSDIYESNETPSPILFIPNLTATSKLPNAPPLLSIMTTAMEKYILAHSRKKMLFLLL